MSLPLRYTQESLHYSGVISPVLQIHLLVLRVIFYWRDIVRKLSSNLPLPLIQRFLLVYIAFRLECDGIILLVEKFGKNVMRVDVDTALSLCVDWCMVNEDSEPCSSGYYSISCLVKGVF
jgi:hypothetical protein